MLSQRLYFSVFASAACFDRHGRIIPQKHSEDRKMEDRKMFAPLCGAPFRHCQHPGMMPNAIFLSFIFLSGLFFNPT